MHPAISSAMLALASGSALSLETVAGLVPLLNEHRLDIYALARLAASASGAHPFACGIINAKSGRCSEDCAFCAQSAHHAADSPVYGLVSTDALLKRAALLAKNGARYMGVVISGTAPSGKDFLRLCESARLIRARVPIRLCASFGLLTSEQARELKGAGYASYHHNLETARSWYGHVCRTHSFEARLDSARNAALAGLRLCCGGIFGLGEGWNERLELARNITEAGSDSIPINFLTPIRGTPLENRPRLQPKEALDIIAIMRLCHPARDIVICGGRTAVLGDWEKALFSAGANGLMIGDYLTTKGGAMERDREMLATLGLDSGVLRSGR